MTAEHIPEKIGHNDSVSRLVKQAVLRGIAIGQLRRETHGAHASRDECNEEILREVLKLSKMGLNGHDIEHFRKLLTDTDDGVKMFSSERFKEIETFCIKLQDGLDSGVNIEIVDSDELRRWATRIETKKVLKSMAEQNCKEKIKNATSISGWKWVPFVGIGVHINDFFEATAAEKRVKEAAAELQNVLNEKPPSEILSYKCYFEALKAVCAKLLEILMLDEHMLASKRDDFVFAINEKVRKNEVFGYEVALEGICREQFVSHFMDTLPEKSKSRFKKFFKSVERINKIRRLFSQQCYIAIVGLQNAGKTTLLNKLWNAGGKTGQRQHTDKAEIFELDPKVFVMDFPGTNGVESHRDTFANCGPMSNFIIIVIKYDGNLNTDHCRQLQQVFHAMAGSNTTQFLLCVNRCDPDLSELLEEDEELKKKANPIDFLRQEYATKINEFNEAGKTATIKVTKENIMFTDWKRPNHKICGAEDVRTKIGEYIKENGIFEGSLGLDKAGLEQCLNKTFA